MNRGQNKTCSESEEVGWLHLWLRLPLTVVRWWTGAMPCTAGTAMAALLAE